MTSSLPIEKWLNEQCALTHLQIQAIPGDASFRRYYRIQHANGSYIAMDASVEQKSCIPFVAISQALRAEGLCTPEIIASDVANGFLLLTDFGDRLYLKELNSQNASQLYGRALTALAKMQRCSAVDGWTLPFFSKEAMQNELNLFREWFLEKHLMLSLSAKTNAMLDQTFDFLATTAAAQPQVFVHRDYHSANLMVLANEQVGILDFQDAFIGPVTYDMVSLLRDCYIAWPSAQVTEWVRGYWEQLLLPKSMSFAEFLQYFDLMGVQRHLKALLTFSRKYCRDGNANYLQHVPRTLRYVLTVSENYLPLRELNYFLKNQVMEKCVE